MTLTLILTRPQEAHPMPTPDPQSLPAHLLRRVWGAVVIDYAYGLFTAYRHGWQTVPRAHSSYGTPSGNTTPAGSGSVEVRVRQHITWRGLGYSVRLDAAVTTRTYMDALATLSSAEQERVLAWLRSGDTPGAFWEGTEAAFWALTLASNLPPLTIDLAGERREVTLEDLLNPVEPGPLNARVRRRA